MTSLERTENVQEIQRSVERMTEMMEDLLLYDRLGAGKIQAKWAPVDVTALCRSAMAEVIAQSGGARSVECIVDPVAQGALLDEKILRHVLDNLLGNALKYSPGDQPVTLEVKCVSVDRPTAADGETRREDSLQLKISTAAAYA